MNIRIDDFDPDSVPPGTRAQLLVEIVPAASGANAVVPVIIVNGRMAGRTLVALAGVHGDEYEGVQAIHDVCRQLDPAGMRGRLIAVPVANVPAHRAGSRETPPDGLNLARVFPGKRDGTLTEKLAWFLSEKIIARADFLLDMHSAGLKYLIPPLVGHGLSADGRQAAAAAAARIFGAPTIWAHPEPIPEGRTISEAHRRGIPWLYVESSGGGRVLGDELHYYTEGLLNLLRHLGIVTGETSAREIRHRLIGNGDIDEAATTSTAGFFVHRVRILDTVARGEIIGEIRDLLGETLEEIPAPRDGVVILLRASPVVNPADVVCVVTGRDEGQSGRDE